MMNRENTVHDKPGMHINDVGRIIKMFAVYARYEKQRVSHEIGYSVVMMMHHCTIMQSKQNGGARKI